MQEVREQQEKMREHQEKSMEEVRSLLLTLQTTIGNQPTSSSTSIVKLNKEIGFSKSIQPKLTRLEFPKFNGERLTEWLYRCRQYFEYDETSGEGKVKLVAIHMEGRALQWHMSYMHGRDTSEAPEWEEYVSALTASEAQVHHDSLNSNRKLIRVVHQQDLINKVALGDRKLYPPPPPQGSQKTAF